MGWMIASPPSKVYSLFLHTLDRHRPVIAPRVLLHVKFSPMRYIIHMICRYLATKKYNDFSAVSHSRTCLAVMYTLVIISNSGALRSEERQREKDDDKSIGSARFFAGQHGTTETYDKMDGVKLRKYGESNPCAAQGLLNYSCAMQIATVFIPKPKHSYFSASLARLHLNIPQAMHQKHPLSTYRTQHGGNRGQEHSPVYPYRCLPTPSVSRKHALLEE